MRKFIILLVVLFIVALGYLGYAHFSGGAVPTFGLPIGGEKANIRKVTLAFFEHVKFKNTSALINFVADHTSPAEISTYLTNILGSDASQIDLTKVAIEQIELNSNQTRARVRVRITGQELTSRKPIDIEKLLFLYHNSDDRWLMDIKSLSL